MIVETTNDDMTPASIIVAPKRLESLAPKSYGETILLMIAPMQVYVP